MSNFLTRALIESDGGNYLIERSLRFNAAANTYLRRTFGTPTNAGVWTLSLWMKRGPLGTGQVIFGENAGNGYFAWFNTSDQIEVRYNGSIFFTSTAKYRDPSAHMNVIWAMNGSATKILVNGFQVDSDFAGVSNLNTAIPHALFCFTNSSNILDGYLSEVHFVDGQALTPSSFGEINQTTGQWVAKRYTGTYGNNGFYLDFKDGTSTTTLGDDKSGNNNDWTLTNFTRSAGVNDCWMLDVPSGNGGVSANQPPSNYCVLNPLHKSSGMSTTNANLTAVSSSTSQVLGSTFAVNSGKWYWEAHIVANNAEVIGVIDVDDVIASTAYPGATTKSYGVYPFSGTKYNNGSGTAYTAAYVAGVVGVKLDLDAGTISFTKLDVDQGIAYSGLTGYKMPACGDLSAGADFTMAHNFGQREFTYSVPSGYKALCTANLPTPSIKKPSDHFNVQLSTGANIKTDSEALFTNELVWIKDRANANNHQLIDSVRGTNAVLQSNTTAAETTYTAPSGSSVGWVWRASDSAPVTNTDGSISSQVSANVAAGFSVVTYTGNGAVGTVGHGLGVAPKLIIIKKRTTGTADIWIVGNSTSGWNNFIQLELTNALAASNGPFNSTAPSSSVFTLGTSTATNQNTSNFVAYCFAEIAGYSKFGSYTGNGSADGINITLGFKPAFVVIKCTDTAGRSWDLFDNKRDGYNVDNDVLFPNLTNAENSSDFLDITSNGFKLRTTDTFVNASGSNYIYWAFAETPFNYANAR